LLHVLPSNWTLFTGILHLPPVTTSDTSSEFHHTTTNKLKHITPHPLPAVNNTARSSLSLHHEPYETVFCPQSTAAEMFRVKEVDFKTTFSWDVALCLSVSGSLCFGDG